MKAIPTIKIKRRGNIFKKKRTGRPLANRTRRIRNTPAPVPRIRPIILHHIGSGVQFAFLIYSSD